MTNWATQSGQLYNEAKWSGKQLAGLPWVWRFPWGFPWIWVWDGYGDCDESPWACGNSVGIFEWM